MLSLLCLDLLFVLKIYKMVQYFCKKEEKYTLIYKKKERMFIIQKSGESSDFKKASCNQNKKKRLNGDVIGNK
jgi:hypothetical protein